LKKYISALPGQAAFPRSVTVLGATGSIGVSTLKIIAAHREKFKVVGLAGARNVKLLAEQALAFRPQKLGVLTPEGAAELKDLLPADYAPKICVGPEGYEDMARDPEADTILAAQVGAAGLRPTFAAVEAGKLIALANKEALVLAGDLIRSRCAATGAMILPVDSEHNALFQAMIGHGMTGLRKLVLTASGGPFRTKTKAELEQVGPKEALNHPNWSMGAKISIDSSTLMNKGLEVIEAYHLFGMGLEELEVVVHPQSIVHSLVEYEDNSMLAQLGPPDMRIPIAYALGWPERLEIRDMRPLSLAEVGILNFEEPDLERFPCLAYAFEALKAGAGGPVVLNAANEIAVDAFLKNRIRYLDIATVVHASLEGTDAGGVGSLEGILAVDEAARATASAVVEKLQA
jgi:1-deoxy-D-xylulose-5-phosphate reductoisomerase